MGDAGGEDRPMRLLQHLEELRKRLKVVFAVFLVVFAFALAFDVHWTEVGGVPVPYPWPDYTNSVSTRVFNATLQHLDLPPDVVPAVANPFEAPMVQIKIAFILALAATVPVAAYEFGMFIRPALRPKERRIVLRIVAPVVALFLLGVSIAYFVILPPTFDFLYTLAGGLGVQQKFLFIDQLVDFLLIFTLAFGLAFQLPVIMWALSAAGIVNPAFWRRHWRFAVLGIFVFGAFITPDGTGVTMMIVALPMLGLFVAGLAAASLAWRGEREPRRALAKD